MSNINVVTVAGNLTKDPELRATASGMTVLNFGIACNESRKNSQTGDWEDYPNFFDATMFGNRAESLSRFLRKGMKVTVKGKLRYSAWEKDGHKHSKVAIIAEEVELPPRQQEAPTPAPMPAPMPSPEVQHGFASLGVPPESIQPSIYDEDIPF